MLRATSSDNNGVVRGKNEVWFVINKKGMC